MPPSPKSLTYIKGMKWWPWKGTLHLCLLSRRTAELTCGLMWLFNMVSANRSITSELMFNPLTSTIDIISCSTNSKPSAEILASLASQQRGPNCLKGCSYNRPCIISERDLFFCHGNIFAQSYSLSLISLLLLQVRSKGNARWGSEPKAPWNWIFWNKYPSIFWSYISKGVQMQKPQLFGFWKNKKYI